MKKLLSATILVLAACLFLFGAPAFAGDAAKGATVFSANCAACHAGGRNLVNPTKTLSKEDLEKYGMNSADAIITQVTNGKASMPSFKGRLKPDQIENVAAYVLSKSEAGW